MNGRHKVYIYQIQLLFSVPFRPVKHNAILSSILHGIGCFVKASRARKIGLTRKISKRGPIKLICLQRPRCKIYICIRTFPPLPRCGYSVALNAACKTMRLPRPFLILSHFPYFCNTRVHFLALTAQACYLFLSCPCICTQNIFFIPRNFFQPSRAFPLYG